MQNIKNFIKVLYYTITNKDEKKVDKIKLEIEKVMLAAKRNRVDNILFYGMKYIDEIYLKNIDQKVIDELKQACILFSVKNIYQQKQFIDIKKIYNKYGIDFVSIKGTEMKKLYFSPDMRVMGDIDIIVTKKDFLKAKEILIKDLKFKIISEDHDELCASSDQKVVVELHKNLSTESSKNQKYFLERFSDNLIYKEDYFTLNTDFHFIYMIDHIYKHYKMGGLSVKYLLDFILYIEQYPMVINNTINELKKINLEKLTYALLVLCNKYMDLDISEYEKVFNISISEESINTLFELMYIHGEYGTEISIATVQEVDGIFWKKHLKKLFPNITYLYKGNKHLLFKIIFYPLRLFYYWCEILVLKNRKIINKIKNHNKIKNSNFDKIKKMYEEI